MSTIRANPALMRVLAADMLAQVNQQKEMLNQISNVARRAGSGTSTRMSNQLDARVSELERHTVSYRDSLERYARFLEAAAQQYEEIDASIDKGILSGFQGATNNAQVAV